MRHHFEEPDPDHEPVDPVDHAQAEFDRIRQMHEQAHKFIKRAQDRQKTAHDQEKETLEPLKIGDLVMVWRDTIEANLSAKLEQKWEGPYLVTRIKGTTHWLKNCHNGLPLPKNFHRNRLKTYHARPPLRQEKPVPYLELGAQARH